MHLVLMTRGINQSMEVWKTFMQAQMFVFRQKPLLKDAEGKFIQEGIDENGHPIYKKGEEKLTRVQGALRPIQLWEYVFPQESLQEVLAMLERHKDYNNLRPEVSKVAWLLRKGMGLKKIPDMPDLKNKESWQITNKYVPNGGVATYLIGIKEDETHDYIFGNEGFNQEGL